MRERLAAIVKPGARLLAALSDQVKARVPQEVRGECMMTVNRLIVGVSVLAATAVSQGGLAFSGWLGAIGTWLAASLLLAGDLVVRPRASGTRRLLALTLDIAGVSIELYSGGGAIAFLYPLYLWIILGNGFRFGVPYSLVGTTLGIAGFGIVALTTPFWRDQPSLVCGLMAALVLIPSYAFMLTRRIAKARRIAEAANRSKNLFLASVSHELRTPLNAIIGIGDMLRTSGLTAPQLEMVTTVNVAADALLGQIGDLLDFARIEAGQVLLSSKTFNLPALLADVQRTVAPQARARGLLLNTFVTAQTPVWLTGDMRRLREILLNLCSNAVKFTEAGFVTVLADGAPAAAGGVELRLEVTDSGIGIEPQAHGRIFQAFQQADERVLDRFGGTGLGLAICDRLVRLMGGQLGVVSEPGRGSMFWLTLHLAAGEAPPPPPAMPDCILALSHNPAWEAALARQLQAIGVRVAEPGGAGPGHRVLLTDLPPAEVGAREIAIQLRPHPADGLPPQDERGRFATALHFPASAAALQQALSIAAALLPVGGQHSDPAAAAQRWTPLRVLVADDNVVNKMVVSRILEAAGHTVLLVENGEQALERLIEHEVDVALMDVNMPVMNGIEATKLYQFTPGADPLVPILGLTADATPETARVCLEAGMKACLTKPIRPIELLRALQDTVPDAAPALPPAPKPPPARLRPDAFSGLDPQALRDLADVGGEAFVTQVVAEFVADAERLIADLQGSVLANDVLLFRDRAHALRSIASNVGARGVRELCGPWQRISGADFEADAPSLLGQLRDEWDRTRAALRQRATEPAAEMDDAAPRSPRR